jgi:hypothetical protein
MFSYVAKTLLSKTLRTFLRTYLDDIELEGINWSSTVDQKNNSGNNSRQGSGSSSSGWGVQLSNVKLREGMELVKLPGKRKRTVIVKKKVKRSNKENKTQSPSSATKAAEAAETDTPRASNRRKINLDRKNVPFEAELPLFNTNEQPPLEEESNDADDNIIVTIDETAVQPQQPYHRDRVFSEDYSDNGYLSSNPSTPKQSRSGFCGIIPTAICKNNGNSINHHFSKIQKYSADEISPFDDDDQRSLGSRSVSFDESSIDNHKNERDYYLAPPPPCNLTDLPLDDDNYDDNDQESYIEIEEECIVEDDMALVVGAGGVIGTLNIRVVDKELHITVEDAHLILEVMPKEVVSETKASSPSKASKPVTVERTTSTSSEADLASATSKNDENTTIGEKVKQKSMFAKILSMIPMLFLRDCRVTLILPEEVDSSGEGDENDEASNDSCDNCIVFELGIDFLSVTSGDDIVDVFQRNTADTPPSKPHRRGGNSVPNENQRASAERDTRHGQDSNYIYERRRIRTGKGPEGGLWLKIHRPNASDIVYGRKKRSNYSPTDKQKWARRRFLDSSQAFCFRCSGIDLHARLVSEKREAVDEDPKNILSDEFEDYTMDSMLFGVDYIDPASITRHANKQKMLIEQRTTPAVDKLKTSERNVDSNGIESIPFSSNFHWIAQNRHRSGCPTSYIPLEECVQCWNTCIEKPSSSSTMDTSMPLPGSVFSLSITDPIEMSVDRNHLDALGYLLSMFISTTNPNKSEDDNNQADMMPAQEEVGLPQRNKTPVEGFDIDSFPSYMQPDSIYISDIHILQLTIRIHALRPSPENDFGLRFGFWELNATSLCCEDQQIDSDELKLSDMTFYIRSLKCLEYKGTCEHSIITVGPVTGLPAKSLNGQNEVFVPYPSTASQILEVPLSSAFDVDMDSSYAVHARLIHRGASKDKLRKQNGFVTLKTGTFHVDIDHSLIGSITSAVNEAKLILVGEQEKATTKPSLESKIASSKLKAEPLWLLQVATKGGNLSYQSLVKVKLPASRYQAKNGTDGFSLETFLNGLGVEYGQSSLETPMPTSLASISVLPESLRLHILLYLDDLSPLEEALKIKRKKKTSAFLRSHTVSKKLSKLQPTAFKRRMISVKEETHRRNDLLSRLQSLDVESLEALLAIHDSFPKKT